MIWTAIYLNTINDSFSRSLVFDWNYDSVSAWENAWEHAEDFESVVCLLKGAHEIWTPDLEQGALILSYVLK